MGSDLYIEELSLTQDNAPDLKECTPYGYLNQLEHVLSNEPIHLDRLTPYLVDIRKALDEKDGDKALMVMDDLEEIMDHDLRNMLDK